MTVEHLQALKELKRNTEVKLLQLEKGSGIVVTNWPQYTLGMNKSLSDASKFHATMEKDVAADQRVLHAISKRNQRSMVVGGNV